MPEIQYRGLVRQSTGNPAKSGKAAHALDFVQSIFHLPAGQAEPVLQAVDVKLLQSRHRLTAPPPTLVQCAAAILAKVLPLPSRLRKPPGASGVSCDCGLDRQNSMVVSWRIEQLSGSAIVSISGICSVIP